MIDMKVEDPIGRYDRNKHVGYEKEKFAKAMNCSIHILDNLERLTNMLSNDYSIDKYNYLVGNIGCRYCGRWYGENNHIWVGLTFDRPVGHKLTVGFYVPVSEDTKDYIEVNKLLKAHYNYYVEYSEIDGCYFFSVFLDNSLENYCSVCSAYEEVKKILQTVRV